MGKDSTDKSIDCKQFAKLIQLILDDEASNEDKKLFKEHESKCNHCAEVFDIEKTVMNLVKNKLRKDCCPEGFAKSVRENALKSTE